MSPKFSVNIYIEKLLSAKCCQGPIFLRNDNLKEPIVKPKRGKNNSHSCGLGGCCVCTTGWRWHSHGQGCSKFLISLFKTTHQHDQRSTLGICDPTTPISRCLSHHPPLTHFCLNRWGHGLNCNSPPCQFTRHGVRSPPAALDICAAFVCVRIRVHVIAACMSQLWLTSRNHGDMFIWKFTSIKMSCVFAKQSIFVIVWL